MTPSYAPDFERCKVLAWSVQTFISPRVKHYIIVPHRDLKLFRQIQQPNVEIIAVESILPSWIKRIPLTKNWWFSSKHILLRGWIIQQLVKLSTAQFLPEDVFVIVDSDLAFVRPFDLQSFVKGDEVRLFRVSPEIATQAAMGDGWHFCAHKLLDVTGMSTPVPGYIGPIVTWRRDNLLKLYQHIEKITGREWIEAACNDWNLSEYIIYGVFVDKVLKEASGHYYTSARICHEYWSTEEMSDEQLRHFFTKVLPDDIAVMISAKANISVQRYQSLIEGIYDNESLVSNS